MHNMVDLTLNPSALTKGTYQTRSFKSCIQVPIDIITLSTFGQDFVNN